MIRRILCLLGIHRTDYAVYQSRLQGTRFIRLGSKCRCGAFFKEAIEMEVGNEG